MIYSKQIANEGEVLWSAITLFVGFVSRLALVAEVDNGEIVALKPDRDHPVTKGFACHKGLATLDIHQDPDRLMYPQRKSGDGFERISWDDAASEIAARLKEIKDKYGSKAIGSYTGNPLAFNALAGPAIGSFMVKNEIRSNFSSGTQDCTNKFAGSEAIFGSSTIHPIQILNTQISCSPLARTRAFPI